MDGLKKVNDTHGHMMGAFVISEVGKIIGGICNTSGQACRYGGDEFIAYLQNTGKDPAVQTGEAICKAVREHLFTKEEVSVKVSISVGVATFPDDGKSIDVLVRAADEALYRAKAAGRDRVSV
jgi:diguanylate cyclase (GGDEF)-like protein